MFLKAFQPVTNMLLQTFDSCVRQLNLWNFLWSLKVFIEKLKLCVIIYVSSLVQVQIFNVCVRIVSLISFFLSFVHHVFYRNNLRKKSRQRYNNYYTMMMI